ncbi:hypothetical protein GCM10009001_03660 [Virgibacillus siamensis]|uniref:Small, acid-soluble spore protein gamma-type n=1 Tax=Virgibacillus siamensis TaxID=480071 RepID=A0ABN1FHJ3_9BACI
MENENQSLSKKDILDQSRRSGMSYNEAKEFIARTTGGHGTEIYSDTDAEHVKRKNRESMNNRKS